MILPDMMYADQISKHKQIKFGGLCRLAGADDGQLWDMLNLTGRDYPLLAVRPKRKIYRKLDSPGGLAAHDALIWVDGTDVYYNGEMVGQVSEGKKTFVSLDPYIVIMPDKVCYHTRTGAFEAMEALWQHDSENESLSCVIDNSAYLSHMAELRLTVTSEEVVEPPGNPEQLRIGDTVIFYGLKYIDEDSMENGYAATIQGIKTTPCRAASGGGYTASTTLSFYENAFSGMEVDGNVIFRIERSVPDLQHMCVDENRIWGCDQRTIYACKLGDPFNWNAFEGVATDSWAVEPGSAGDFTGCINYQGNPTFFKEDRVYKVYGSIPSNFEVVDSPILGVAKGCADTLAVVGTALFYLGTCGIMAYAGTTAQPVGQDFGNIRFVSGVAGSDGLCYYASLQDAQSVWRLCVYDAQKGLWHIEDALQAVYMCRFGGNLYCLSNDGTILLLGDTHQPPDGCAEEGIVPWMVEFGDFTHEDPNHKGVSKLQLRLWMDEDSKVLVELQFDSDGSWRTVRSLYGADKKRSYYLPIIPRRCDHYRLRISGKGNCVIHSLVRESYNGSEKEAK